MSSPHSRFWLFLIEDIPKWHTMRHCENGLLAIRQTADTVGVSRSTIYRKVDEGVLSTTNLSDGSKGVDTSELIRMFGELKPRHEETALDNPEVVARQTHATGSDTTRSDNHETIILKTKIELLEDLKT